MLRSKSRCDTKMCNTEYIAPSFPHIHIYRIDRMQNILHNVEFLFFRSCRMCNTFVHNALYHFDDNVTSFMLVHMNHALDFFDRD